MSTALYLLSAHVAADFLTQTDQMAAKKLDDVDVRAMHVTHHVVFTTVAVEFTTGLDVQGWLFVAGVGLAHFAIDSRRWVDPKPDFETWPIWYDQALHVASIAAVHAMVYA